MVNLADLAIFYERPERALGTVTDGRFDQRHHFAFRAFSISRHGNGDDHHDGDDHH